MEYKVLIEHWSATDYTFVINDTEGYVSDDDHYFIFEKLSDYQKFLKYKETGIVINDKGEECHRLFADHTGRWYKDVPVHEYEKYSEDFKNDPIAQILAEEIQKEINKEFIRKLGEKKEVND